MCPKDLHGGLEAAVLHMKFMMNVRLTLETATAPQSRWRGAGEDNIFLFGLSADQVADRSRLVQPWWHYTHEPETRADTRLDLQDHSVASSQASSNPIRDTLSWRDYICILAGLTSYADARLASLPRNAIPTAGRQRRS